MSRQTGKHRLDKEAQRLEAPRHGVASFLRQRMGAILHSWETRVSSEQREVELRGVALRNEVPELLEDLATWLASDAEPEPSLVAARALAHVVQRLDAGLALEQVFREYRLLREILIEEVLVAEAAEQERAGALGEEARIARVEELARLNAGLDVVLAYSIERFVEERERRAAAERTRTAQALRGSEMRYRSLFDSMDEGFCVIEVLYEDAQPVDGRFLEVNPAFERHTGLNNATGRRMREMLPDLDQDWFETYGKVAQTGEAEHFESAFRALRRCYDVHAFRVGAPEQRQVAVLFNDVTERRRAEEELLKKQKELAEAQRLAHVGSWRWELASDEVACSDELLHIFGLASPPPPLPAQSGTMYPPDSWERLNAAVQDSLRTGASYELELEAQRSNGERIWVTARGEATRDASGAITGVHGTIQDVTERKEIEAALQNANASLVDSDRRKNHFLAVLSHELRNPLTPIKNSLFILDRAAPEGDQARRAKNVIERQIDLLSHLVDDLLDLTRITRGKIQLQRRRMELRELVRHTIDDHRAVFQAAEVRLELQVAAHPVFVDADWNRTAQVLSNLLQNAAKFTPRDGRVMVTVERDDRARLAVIRIVDTGLGMKPDVVARLFEPFTQADETLDRSKGGLGLGLALAKGIVEQHGGGITANSQGLDRGSEFVVHLPLEPDSPTTDERTPAHALGGRHRVLIIEDNVDAAHTLKETLELLGHKVAVAYEGREGLAKAREFRPNFVLCDIGLPGLDGYDIARAFRADDTLRDIHLIALSGYALPEDQQKAAEAGFERHLAKPPSIEKLEGVLVQMSSR